MTTLANADLAGDLRAWAGRSTVSVRRARM